MRSTGVLMLPTSAVMVALAVPLVTLYRVGEFTAEDVPLVASALRWWAGGLIFYALTMFLLRAFYSLKDTRTPMWVNLALTGGVQIALYWLLSTGIGSWHGIGINGMPIADVTFYLCVSITLAVLLRRRIGGYDARGVAWTFARMTIASVIGGAVAWGVTQVLDPLSGRVVGALIQIAAGGAAGLAVAFGLGRLFGVAEVADGDHARSSASSVAASHGRSSAWTSPSSFPLTTKPTTSLPPSEAARSHRRSDARRRGRRRQRGRHRDARRAAGAKVVRMFGNAGKGGALEAGAKRIENADIVLLLDGDLGDDREPGRTAPGPATRRRG